MCQYRLPFVVCSTLCFVLFSTFVLLLLLLPIYPGGLNSSVECDCQGSKKWQKSEFLYRSLFCPDDAEWKPIPSAR